MRARIAPMPFPGGGGLMPALCLGVCTLALPSGAEPEEAVPFARLFDTGSPLRGAGGNATHMAPKGWTQVPHGRIDHRFRADAVLVNDRIAVVLVRNARGAILLGRGKGGDLRIRSFFSPDMDATDARLSSIEIIENEPEKVVVDAWYAGPDGEAGCLRLGIEGGRPAVKTVARRGVKDLLVAARSRFLVLPDFFADDIVIDARQIPVSPCELPGENFLLHPLGDGDAILMSVWERQGDDLRIRLRGGGKDRRVEGVEIPYGEDGAIWIALLEGRGIWHVRDVRSEEAGKRIGLAWTQPFPAQWRVDWRTAEGEIDSWEMMVQRPNGRFAKPDWFGQEEATGTPDWQRPDGTRWNTELGRFMYPCWVDRRGRGFFQPLEKGLRFRGPAIIYAIGRVRETPLDAFTVIDLVRATLGIGPCEYILDVEGQRKKALGVPTCATRTLLNEIYKSGEQVKRKAEVEKALDDVHLFVRHIRDRIEEYAAFGHEMLDYLQQQKKAHPEFAEFLDEMAGITGRIHACVARREESIKTPAFAARLIDDFRENILGYEGADAYARCQAFGRAITRIGGSQDGLVAECRRAVRTLRQRAALRLLLDPRLAGVAHEIRRRTRAMLRNPVSYEAPRH